MEEFLNQNYSVLTKVLELIAAFTGLLLLRKYKKTSVKYFIYFLVYVAIIELIAAYPRYVEDYEFLSSIKTILKGTKFERNFWWYTISWYIGSTLFYSFYFRMIINNKRYVNIIWVTTLIFIISAIINIVVQWETFFVSLLPFVNNFGTGVILMCVIFYFTEILQSDKILSFHKSINFIISTVLLIWFLIVTPLVFYQMYFSTADWQFIFSRRMIFLFSNIFMYLTFTFALIWCKPQNN